MRALLFHCKKFNANITGLSTRGIEVAPETITKDKYDHDQSIVAWITVEKGDDVDKILPRISKEIEKFCIETKEEKITICPFAHLSNNLASFKDGIDFFNKLEDILKNKYEIVRVHFGSDKDMMLHLFGHPGNARYREF